MLSTIQLPEDSHIKKFCELYKSEDLVKRGFFGMYTPNKKLLERIGDYTLIAKKNYSLIGTWKGDKIRYHKGHHSGVSED